MKNQQVTVNFEFEDENYKSINFLCSPTVKMDKVIDQFKNKIKSDKDPREYLFYNKNSVINTELTISDLQKINGNNINIAVRKRTKFTKCPDCVANTSLLEIENYGLHYYGCKNHPDIKRKTFDEYEDSQKINYNRIKCAHCRKTRIQVLEMYKCLTCTKNNINKDASFYICNTCLDSQKHQEHITVKYDDKNYYCLDGCKYSSYCETCQRDLCKNCQKEHENHEIIEYDDIIPEIKSRQKELEQIKEYLIKAKISIQNLLKMMNDAYDTLENYYNICNDMLYNYDSFNKELRNYHTIQNINFLETSNKEVIEDLNYLIKNDNSKETYSKQCEILINTFFKERKNYAGENIDKPQKTEVIQSESNNNNQKSTKVKKNGRSISNKPE